MRGQGLPPAAPESAVAPVPRPRGFNLQAMFNVGTRRPFDEADFRLIAGLGFNFVRLPLDYRCWIRDGDWRAIDEDALVDIDRAITYGRHHGVHVSLNFHRAPGYTVAPPAETRSLWHDPEALAVCELHWVTFARRYRGVPPDALSFNLLNEPADVDAGTYARVIEHLIAAIRRVDPLRPIVVDGLEWGRRPPELSLDGEDHVIFATRGYTPIWLTHRNANWVAGSDAWPMPSWPWPQMPGTLYGPDRTRLAGPLELTGHLPAGTRLELRVAQVSDSARLRVVADGTLLLDRIFLPGEEPGDASEVIYNDEWGVYQNLYDLSLPLVLGRRTHHLRIVNAAGDWLRLDSLAVYLPEVPTPSVLHFSDEWGRAPGEVTLTVEGERVRFQTEEVWDADWLWRETVSPWIPPQRAGFRILVGEFGVYRHTPHDVTLRWMRDALENWQAVGWGWALWNFSGPFGIFDSERGDVDYEEYEGRQLDRKMLDLLQQY